MVTNQQPKNWQKVPLYAFPECQAMAVIDLSTMQSHPSRALPPLPAPVSLIAGSKLVLNGKLKVNGEPLMGSWKAGETIMDFEDRQEVVLTAESDILDCITGYLVIAHKATGKLRRGPEAPGDGTVNCARPCSEITSEPIITEAPDLDLPSAIRGESTSYSGFTINIIESTTLYWSMSEAQMTALHDAARTEYFSSEGYRQIYWTPFCLRNVQFCYLPTGIVDQVTYRKNRDGVLGTVEDFWWPGSFKLVQEILEGLGGDIKKPALMSLEMEFYRIRYYVRRFDRSGRISRAIGNQTNSGWRILSATIKQ